MKKIADSAGGIVPAAKYKMDFAWVSLARLATRHSAWGTYSLKDFVEALACFELLSWRFCEEKDWGIFYTTM
ncbi:hypothetical protein SAMN04488109_5308 [Chryseolinea serpens]|uniref:Uncharacterized protein n=1 Tax=Chryseolinea serpens TaxID=947013 RepID=A0A1M5VR49_9BACT|nr:hypothetical protein [Chryseolinea serpens]SHH77454.1 hypothetical protein SAMN04488109_5308 [Chryseolinea serpens]